MPTSKERHTHFYSNSPSDTVPAGDSDVGFLQGSFCFSGSSAPPELHATSQCTLSTSLLTPGAVVL